MLFSFAILLILCGLGIMGFGLLLFYAWLPLLYGLFGFEVGFLLGKWLTADVGVVAFTLGIVGAVGSAGAAYFLEPYRRVLVGFMGGAGLALALLSVFGLERLLSGFSGVALAIGGGLIGSAVALRYFDLFIVTASSFGGAALVVTGAQLLLPTPAEPSGSFLPALLAVILGVFGLRWQLSNIASWVRSEPASADPLVARVGKQENLRNP